MHAPFAVGPWLLQTCWWVGLAISLALSNGCTGKEFLLLVWLLERPSCIYCLYIGGWHPSSPSWGKSCSGRVLVSAWYGRTGVTLEGDLTGCVGWVGQVCSVVLGQGRWCWHDRQRVLELATTTTGQQGWGRAKKVAPTITSSLRVSSYRYPPFQHIFQS